MLDGWISRSLRADRMDGPLTSTSASRKGPLPLLFHNGTPSSGQLYDPFVQAASQRGLRMVSFSRAGYGDSTRNPGRSVAHVIPDSYDAFRTWRVAGVTHSRSPPTPSSRSRSSLIGR